MEFVFKKVHLVTAGIGVNQKISRLRSDRKGEPSIAQDVLVQAAMARQISSDQLCIDRRRPSRNQDGINQEFGAKPGFASAEARAFDEDDMGIRANGFHAQHPEDGNRDLIGQCPPGLHAQHQPLMGEIAGKAAATGHRRTQQTAQPIGRREPSP